MNRQEFASKQLIRKGWSKDKKYCLTKKDGTKYLLRISPPELYEKKRAEFERMERAAALGIPMCLPLEFGSCEEGVYSLQSFIEGEDAEELLPSCTEKEQAAFGREAGRILRKIHSIPAPEDQEEWEIYFNRKADFKIALYRECPVRFDGAEKMIDYLNANRKSLQGRPQCYQHGDYHVGNMRITPERQLVIIDFDRDDYGDPWEEFNRIVWSAQCSPAFAGGMVDGYFGKDVPMEFWRLLALYISSNLLGSIPWAIAFGQSEIDTMLRQAAEIYSWYDGMQNIVPSWYRPAQG